MIDDRILFLFGVGFLAANLLAAAQVVRAWLRSREAVLVWPQPRPPLRILLVGIGITLGLLIAYNLVSGQARPAQLFGESMMFLYYAVAVHLKQRVRLGFYAHGILTDKGFVPYPRIDAVHWQEQPHLSLVIASRARGQARRITVPVELYGAARRALRDRLAAHELSLAGTTLDLGARDGSEDV